MAAGGKAFADRGHDARDQGLFGDEVQHRDQQHGDRPVEVQSTHDLGMRQQRLRLAHVGLHDRAVAVVREQRAAVHQNDRIVVGVDHPGLGVDAVRDLVDVLLRGQP